MAYGLDYDGRGTEPREGARCPLQVRLVSGKRDVDVLRRSGASVKGNCVAADEDGLNRILGERLQQLFQVGG
jgi:hypothetical protein